MIIDPTRIDKDHLRELRHSIARAYGIDPHRQYTERQAAGLLVPPNDRRAGSGNTSTLKRKRHNGKIPHVPGDDGSVAYLGMMLVDFIAFGERSVLLWGADRVDARAKAIPRPRGMALLLPVEMGEGRARWRQRRREGRMGRYRKREHAAGRYWLDKRANSPAWCICWMEGRQLRRKSTGTEDLDAAIQALKAHYLAEDTPEALDVTRVPIADILRAYYLQHGQHISSRKWITYGLGHWLRFYGETTSVWAATRPGRIERFIDDLRGRGLKPSSVNTILTVGRSATGRAWKRGELTRQIHVPSVRVKRMEPKGRPLSVEESAAWLDAAAPHFHALLFLCLATGSRPEAVKELRWAQVDFDDGLLHLNPAEREQTSKRRPVVRMPPSLIAYLRHLPRESDHVVSFRGRAVDRYYTALGESRRRAGLDGRVNLYSARHTVARRLRKQRVPFEEVAGQLGHRMPGFAITEIYAAYSPDYQMLATAAIERLLQAIAVHAHSCRFLVQSDTSAVAQQGLAA